MHDGIQHHQEERHETAEVNRAANDKNATMGLLINEYKQRGRSGHLKSRASRTNFESFRPNTRLCDIDKRFCVDYGAWLQSEHLNPQRKVIALSTAFSYFWYLGIILPRACQNGHIKNNPWKLLSDHEKIRQPEGKREFLTLEEINKLENTHTRRITYAEHFFSLVIAVCVWMMSWDCNGATYPSMEDGISYQWQCRKTPSPYRFHSQQKRCHGPQKAENRITHICLAFLYDYQKAFAEMGGRSRTPSAFPSCPSGFFPSRWRYISSHSNGLDNLSGHSAHLYFFLLHSCLSYSFRHTGW